MVRRYVGPKMKLIQDFVICVFVVAITLVAVIVYAAWQLPLIAYHFVREFWPMICGAAFLWILYRLSDFGVI